MALPDSFALNPSGEVVLQDAVQTGGPATQIDGGGAGSAPQAVGAHQVATNWQGIAETGYKTLDAVNRLADGALKPYVERMEKQQFYEGMSKVVQGQTLQQIAKDDPWYMNIFGPSATVRGAQAMTATTALQQAETEFLSNMDTLRQQSPDQVRGFLVQQASSLGNTGDPLVDATIQAKMAESWGPMLKTHMREHLAWQQQDMMQKQTNNNVSIAQGLTAQRRAASTGWDPAEQAAAYENAWQSAAPAPGQSRDSWNRGMLQSLTASLQGGHFDYFNAIKASPLWKQLDTRGREALEEHLPMYVMKDAQSNPATTQITNNLAGFEFNLAHGGSGISTVGELDKAIDQYNDQYKERTGAEGQLINNARRAELHKQWMAGKAHLQQAIARSQAGDAKALDSAYWVAQAFTTGNYASLKGIELDRSAVAATMDELFNAEVGSNDPQRVNNYFRRAAQSSSEEKLRSPKFEMMLHTGVNGFLSGGSAEPTKEQIQAIRWAGAMYKAGDNGPEALSAYLGADRAAKVAGFLNAGVNLDDPKAIVEWRKAMQAGAVPDMSASADERKRVHSVVAAENPGWLKQLNPFAGPGALTPYKPDAETVEALARSVERDAIRYSRAFHISVEEATKIKLGEALKNADLIGGAIVPAQANVDGDRSLAAAVNRLAKVPQSSVVYQDAVKNVVANQLTANVAAAGGDMRNFSAGDWRVRSGQQVGNGMVMLFLMHKDQTKAAMLGMKIITLHPNAVVDEINRLDKERGTRKPSDGPQQSPALDPEGFESKRREAMRKAGILTD
ncbi:hypothetical protein [Cupriavidus sp. H39]|uniref:hypothetical protein n=1 Tax=Cupriavidus sp. H39 TaxID=3401635 RepID=UPI003D02DC1F